MFLLEYNHKIVINDIPLQWMTKIELFSSDLEQFPLMYVHLLSPKQNTSLIGEYNPANKQRIFGFVISASWGQLKTNGLCDVELSFISNIPQHHHVLYDEVILNELEHRVGIADKVSYEDLALICQKAPKSLPVLQKIWKDKIEVVYGDFIPHGRIFDRMYGIIRFSASGNAPRLGKISEYRMLYWYMVDLGEKITFSHDAASFSFIEFYLIPTYEELLSKDFSSFPNFSNFFVSTKAFWELEYTEMFSVSNFQFRSAAKGKDNLPVKAENFESKYSDKLKEHYDNISRLRQIFNRMPSRLYGYIWNIMTPTYIDFYNVFSDRNRFKEFYKDCSNKKGSSSKVVACFLQQAFGVEAFPIDTWVKTFIYYVLGMNPQNNGKGNPSKDLQDELYKNYSKLDKLEKIIWVSSMGNKTNKTEFLDILWCQRYGTDQDSKGPCRGANPISCSMCILREDCLGYSAISKKVIQINGNIKKLEQNMLKTNSYFGILTEKGTPRKVYTLDKTNFSERDSHSGLDIPTTTTISGKK